MGGAGVVRDPGACHLVGPVDGWCLAVLSDAGSGGLGVVGPLTSGERLDRRPEARMAAQLPTQAITFRRGRYPHASQRRTLYAPMSTPTPILPSCWAAVTVVPEPANGSSTISPGHVLNRIHLAGTSNGNVAG